MLPLPDPRDNPVTGHLYQGKANLADMLWGEVHDDPGTAEFMLSHLHDILDRGEFPDDYVGDGYTIEVLSTQQAVIEFNFDESQRQDLPLVEILDALELIAAHGSQR